MCQGYYVLCRYTVFFSFETISPFFPLKHNILTAIVGISIQSMAEKAWSNYLHGLALISYQLMHAGIPVLGVGCYDPGCQIWGRSGPTA